MRTRKIWNQIISMILVLALLPVSALAQDAELLAQAESAGLLKYLEVTDLSANLSRLDAVKLLVAMMGLKPVDGATLNFTDCDALTQEEKELVAAAVNAGLILGNADDTFTPFGVLTKAQLATVIYRALGEPKTENSGGAFPQWYGQAVAALQDLGIITEDNILDTAMENVNVEGALRWLIKATTLQSDNGTHEHSGEWKYDTDNHWLECACGEQFDYAEHDWKLVEEFPASCRDEGYEIYHCACGAEKTETYEKLECNLVTIPGQEATCTEWGWYEYQECSVCGGVYDFKDIRPLDHIDENKDHECDRDCGEIDMGEHADSTTDKDHVCDYGCGAVLEECYDAADDEDQVCDICGAEIACEHTGDWKYDDDNHWRVCDECGEQFDYAEHDWKLVEEFPASCRDEGYEIYHCACGAEKTETYEKLECNLVTIPGQEATCTEWGWYEYQECTVCGGVYNFKDIRPLEHDYDDGVVTKEPTITEVGVKTYTCKREGCGDHYTEEIPMLEAIARGTCGEDLVWGLDKEGILTISGTGAMYDFKSAGGLEPHSVIPMNETSLEVAPWSAYSSQIKQVVVKDGVTSIGDNAFADCEQLTEVKIPKTVTEIGDDVFTGCEALETVTYSGTEEQWEEIEIGAGKEVVEEKVVISAVLMGDVTGDGKINVGDAVKLLKAIASKTTDEFSDEMFKAADVTRDGKLNVGDAVKLLKAIASKTTDEL